MLHVKWIRRSSLQVAGLCALALSGCAATMIPSQRLHEPGASNVISGPNQRARPAQFGGHRFGAQVSPACASCEDRQRLQDYAHHAMPYVAGPFMHECVESEYAAQQAMIQPPHSKFHPVPTRPVFETRASYSPPQPMGIQLVPVPDQRPPLYDAMGTRDFEEADTVHTLPPTTSASGTDER